MEDNWDLNPDQVQDYQQHGNLEFNQNQVNNDLQQEDMDIEDDVNSDDEISVVGDFEDEGFNSDVETTFWPPTERRLHPDGPSDEGYHEPRNEAELLTAIYTFDYVNWSNQRSWAYHEEDGVSTGLFPPSRFHDIQNGRERHSIMPTGFTRFKTVWDPITKSHILELLAENQIHDDIIIERYDFYRSGLHVLS